MNPMTARVWESAELTFEAKKQYEKPFGDVEFRVSFEGPNGSKLVVPGFWDGGNSWMVRFAPIAEGEWRWSSVCSVPEDDGLHGVSGALRARGWSKTELADQPNRRGFLHVHENGRYFEYADGTPFYWLGDTMWAGHTRRCDMLDALPRYLRDRKDKGFSVIQMVVGSPTIDERDEKCDSYIGYSGKTLANEGGAPFTKRYDEINPAYFRALDDRIRLMTDMGFVPCLMAMWGQELGAMTVETAKAYWRYIIARYAAYNVLWSTAGEYLFTWDVEGWRDIGEEIDRADPYGHPTSAHAIAPHSGSMHYQGDKWYDFNLIQVGHVLAFKNFMEQLPLHDYRAIPVKPAIMSESWYENHPNRVFDDGNWIVDRDIRFAAYVSLLQGCVGQTYGAHGIWSMFDGEEADKWEDDERPDLWWNDLQLPGSAQMKHVRTLMESVDWWKLEPHPESVSTVASSNVYCAAVPLEQYIVYCTGGAVSVPVIVMIATQDGELYEGRWFNPRTGEWRKVEGHSYSSYGCGWMWRAFTPDGDDWVLRLERGREQGDFL